MNTDKKHKDETSLFREYMFHRAERREHYQKLLMSLLVVIALLLATFLVGSYVFNAW